MDVIPTEIPDVKRILVKRFEDARGHFSQIFTRNAYLEAGLPGDFVQDNRSFSRRRGTVRGLHYQLDPDAQDKLVWVDRGSILDVAVDIRKESPTFGKHVRILLKADAPELVFVPAGFAHGFCTLEPDTEVVYKVTRYYSPAHERGILWNDPELRIDWPVSAEAATLSDKDRVLPPFSKVL